MSIFIDIAIVAIIGLSIFLGYKKGLIGVAFKIISFFLAIILAFILCKPVSNYIIQQTTIDDKIQETIQNTLGSEQTEEEIEQNENQNNENMPQIITDYIQEEVTKVAEEAQNQVATIVAQNVTATIINAISFIGIFIVLKIVLLVLKIFSEQLANIPIIKQFNKLGGTIYGILRGFFLIYLVFGILSFVLPMFADTSILMNINNSYIGSIFYNHNLLLKMLF